MRLALWLAAAAALVAWPPVKAGAQPLVADLSSHLIAITTGFTGTSVVLFGATDGAGDVIVVVRGPERDIVVRRKSRVAGIWVNTRRVTFLAAPSFYAVLSSRPPEDVAPHAVLAAHQIGLGNLKFAVQERRTAGEIADFRSEFIAEQERQGLYHEIGGTVSFLGDRLFRASIDFPANVPTGTYLVEVFLARGQNIVTGQTTPLVISQAGVDAAVNDFATRWALLYGAIAVLVAVVAGWLSSLPFRNA